MDIETRILFLEDNEEDLELMQRALKHGGLNFIGKAIQSSGDYIKALTSFLPDIILSDYTLPSFSGIAAFELKEKIYPDIPLIIVSGTIEEENAVELIKKGVTDYVPKDKLFSLPVKVYRALAEKKDKIEKANAERALVHSESRLKKAGEIAHLGSWELDFTTGVAIWSDETCRIFGIDKAENKQSYESWCSFIHPEDLEFVLKHVKESQDSLTSTAFFHRILRLDGSTRHVYSEIQFEFDTSGKPVGLFGIAHDVTEIKQAESALLKSAMNYKNLLDNMNDGFMVDDISGNVVFANERYCEIFGISKNELADMVLEDYVAPEYHEKLRDRHNRRVAGEDVPDNFEYIGLRRDGTRIWVEVHVKPIVEDGEITGTQSVIRDITERKQAEAKIAYANRLYAFISQINQAIVHINDPATIFKEACRIAVEFGKFKMAWIGLIDQADKRVELVAQCGIPPGDVKLFSDHYQPGGPQDKVLETNSYYVCNNIQKDLELDNWKPYGASRGIGSCMVLPLKKGADIAGTLNIYASETDFFNEDEIMLLEEATGDISFALDIYEKEKMRLQAETQLEKAYYDIKTLLDNTDEMFITVGKNLEIVSFNKNARDGCRKYLGKELIAGGAILEYTSPDRVELLRKLYSEVLAGEKRQTESVFEAGGEKVHFRSLMKPILNSAGETEGVFVIEQNVTELIKKQGRIEFDQHNLNALISNTSDLMWSVDRNYKLITANDAFGKMVKQMAGKVIEKGDSVLSPGFGDEQLAKYKRCYDRAFSGESFTETDYTHPPYENWSEISYNPIWQGEAVIGTACYAHNITQNKRAEAKLIHANRMYAFTSQINQAIVHANDEQALFDETCRIAIAIGKFDLAGISFIDKRNRKLNLVAQSNGDADDIKVFTSLAYAENGPTEYVMRNKTHHVINDFSDEQEGGWKQYAGSKGFRSMITLPFKKLGEVVFTLNLFSQKRNIFDSEEIVLLEEAANEISFALDFFEKEKLHLQAEEKLKHSELRLKQAQAIAHIGSWEEDISTGAELWSEEACRIYGIPEDEQVQTFESWITFIHPDDLERVMGIVNEARGKQNNLAFHHRIIRRDGTVRYIHSHSQYEFNAAGVVTGKYGVAHDVTEAKVAEERLVQANRMYAFTSQINQTIVHVTDEQVLFDEACRIGVSVGGFELACINRFDEANRKLNLVAQNNADQADVALFSSLEFTENGAIAKMLLNDKYYVINDYSRETEQGFWSQYAFLREFKSAIILPVRKLGKTQFVLSLFSKVADIFDQEEIALLEEAADDISFALDVFEKDKQRKQFEDKIKHNEARLKQAQKIAHLGSWELDFSTGVATWSEEACRIYGLDPQDNIQSYEAWVSFIHPGDLDYVMKITKAGQETLSSTAMYHRIIRTDGAVRHLFSQAQFQFNNDGKPIGLYGVAHDITDMKEAEEEIQQSKENLRLIVDLIPQSIFAMDGNGKFVFVNKSFAELYGTTPKELVYKTIYETIPDKSTADGFVGQAREVISTGITQVIPELTFSTYTGEKKTFYSLKVPFDLAGKEERAMLGISLDITDQKKAEQERSKMIADIVQRNKDLEQFSYIVSHNLRAPVANIIGLSELLQILEPDKEEGSIMMRGLSESVKKLDIVIKDINHVLQVKHQVNEKKELVKFSELCEDIQASIENLLRSEDVQIIADFSEVDEMLTFKSYLYSIFFNLISNSIKYHQPGVSPVIKMTSRKDGKKIELEFQDNGLGIDLERSGSQVFGLYKRFHHHTEGKGMGLYMVKTQVETLGGRIHIESAVNRGTLFRITFENN